MPAKQLSLFFLILGLVITMLGPILYEQLMAFVQEVPNYIQSFQQAVIPKVTSIVRRLDPDAIHQVKETVGSLSAGGFKIFTKLLKDVWSL